MSVEDHTVSFSLEINVEQAYQDIRKFQTLLYRTLNLVSRLGPSEELQDLIDLMQRAIVIANSLRLALLALQAARLKAGDPMAAAMLGLAVGEAIATLVAQMEMESPEY